MSDTITVEDPLSRGEIELPVDVEVDEIINSLAANVELEIVSPDPMTFEGTPELEEDWGE